MDYKIGLKLGTINTQFTDEILQYYKAGIFHYIELFAISGTFDDTISYWKQFDIPFGIHAPHSAAGLNVACAENRKINEFKIAESIRFADALKAQYIIFHPGVNGESEETITQLSPYADERFLIENKPAHGISGSFCVGSTYEDLKKIIDGIGRGTGFCLDFGHAICAANTFKKDPFDFIRELCKLTPRIYHLTDGDFKSEIDIHPHYGEGSFPLKQLLAFVPPGGMVTNEAQRKNTEDLKEFKQDYQTLKKILYN